MSYYEYGTILGLLELAGIPVKKVGVNRVMGVCPICYGGHKTPCCSYLLDKNVWKCFSCGNGGGIKKLKEVLNLNVSLNNFVTGKVNKVYNPSDITQEIKPFITRQLDNESMNFLKKREINLTKISRFVRFISPKKRWYYQKGFRLAVPSFDKDGRTRNVKIRNVFTEEKRKELDIDIKVISWKGGENYSIGLNWIPENADFILIVEGEIDFLSVKSIDPKFPVIGIPSANYRFKDEQKWFPKNVFVLLDNDQTGEYHSQRLKSELTDSGFNVNVLRYPKVKDFNELLLLDKEMAERLLLSVKKKIKKRRKFFIF